MSVRDNPWFDADKQKLGKLINTTRTCAHTGLTALQSWLEDQQLTANNWIATKGTASEVIPAAVVAMNVDLVVMGTIARTGIPSLLTGNTAENVLARINCPVVALKPDTFVSPATGQPK